MNQKTYHRTQSLIREGDCVVLDGGIATELERQGLKDHHISDAGMWGTWALYHMPHAVLDMHRRYAQVGCDVISTNTWAILSAPEVEARTAVGRGEPTHWMDGARRGIRLARQAIDEAGRTGSCAVAFSVNGDIEQPDHQATLQLLARVLQEDPPDLILMETLSLIRENLTFQTIELMLDTGLPVWLSFRRCRHGVCGVHGQHWGGPEGDLFGRAAHRFEKMGVGALLINCLPIDHVPGMLPWLRDFTDMPLGVYPNLGRYLDPGWMFDDQIDPTQYGQLARGWRDEGAQIVGGCCGVMPDHIAAVRRAVEGTKPGRKRPGNDPVPVPRPDPEALRPLPDWTDERRRSLYPLPFPQFQLDPGVFEPTEGSFLMWKHLFRNGLGSEQRCLDVGCGCGLLAIQLALNGASSVDAIDISRDAIANTMANAYRNDVDARIKARAEDLFTFTPGASYDLIVASLYQMPVDPYAQHIGHRPQDYWGRNLVDHLIRLLPQILTADGTALVMQLSILGRLRTAELLDEAGLESQIVDFDTFGFGPVFQENLHQIDRVEQLSDAYHLKLGRQDVMVAYLLEIRRKS